MLKEIYHKFKPKNHNNYNINKSIYFIQKGYLKLCDSKWDAVLIFMVKFAFPDFMELANNYYCKHDNCCNHFQLD